MQASGVLKPVNHVTTLDPQFVTAEKKKMQRQSKIRISLVPTNHNKAITREPFYYKTPDDIFHNLSWAEVFTIVNFSKGYQYVQLEDKVQAISKMLQPPTWRNSSAFYDF